MQRWKKAAALLLAALFFSLPQTQVFAAETLQSDIYQMTGATPRWSYVHYVLPSLSFNGSKASCGASVYAPSSDVTKITAILELSRKNSDGSYTVLKTWDDLETAGRLLDVSKVYFVSTGYTYRLTVTATVHAGNSSETVSAYCETDS